MPPDGASPKGKAAVTQDLARLRAVGLPEPCGGAGFPKKASPCAGTDLKLVQFYRLARAQPVMIETAGLNRRHFFPFQGRFQAAGQAVAS